MTLRTKASVILCLLISFTLGITGYYYLGFFENSLRDSILKGLSSVGITSSEAISRFLSDTLKEANAVARALPREALENRDAESIEQTLKDYLAIFPKFENGMFILDANGKLWTDYPAHPEIRGRSFGYRQYFKRTISEQRGIIGTPYRSARTGKPVLTFTAVLKNRAGGIVGMLGCSVQLTSPKALEGIRLTRIGQTGYIYVYNKDRLMILHPKEERILKKDVPVGANRLFDAAIEGFEGTGETVNSRGISMLISLKHIDGTDWILGCQQPASEAYAPIAQARARIIMGIVLAAFTAVILGALIMRKITVPLMRLQEASRMAGSIAEKKQKIDFNETRFERILDGIPEKGEIGDLKHAFRTMHDQLDRTMKSLRELAADWANTFDSVKDVIILLDRNHCILRLNRPARHLIEKSDAEAAGLPIRECLETLPQELFPETGLPPEDRQFITFTIEMKTVQGDLRTYEMTSTPLIDGEQNDIGTILLGKDITAHLAVEKENSRLEKMLLKAQKMEAIGTLAGGVAHDLNNILSGILSYPELLLMQLPEDSTMRKPLETIMQSGAKASAIVQDLLTLARRGVPSVDVMDLNDIINEYFNSPEFAKLKYHHPGLRVETDLAPDLLPIEGSRVHLSKTIMNMVSNAAEAMPEGGTVSLSTSNQTIDKPVKGYEEIGEGDYVVIRISDKGMGIDADELERIFEPFYTKKVMGRSGTGLGMSVVWGTVKDHNGYIDVRSEVGAWTEFTLYFPATRKKQKQKAALRDAAELCGNGETVLVVDDVEEQRTIAVSILNQLGYTADAVPSGSDAIDYLKARPVDLLVLDMIMPQGMDGYETYQQAVEIHPGQKAVIASGFSETELVKKTQALGAGTYIKKPYTIEKIGLAVKEELSG